MKCNLILPWLGTNEHPPISPFVLITLTYVRLTRVVDDAIRDLDELWKENQETVPSLLQKATVGSVS